MRLVKSYFAQNVRTRMPECITPFVSVKSKQRKLAIFFQRPIHIPQNSIHLRNQRVRGQALRNLLRHIKRRGVPFLPFLNLPIGQRNPISIVNRTIGNSTTTHTIERERERKRICNYRICSSASAIRLSFCSFWSDSKSAMRLGRTD